MTDAKLVNEVVDHVADAIMGACVDVMLRRTTARRCAKAAMAALAEYEYLLKKQSVENK